jgi:lipoate-protein ligase A
MGIGGKPEQLLDVNAVKRDGVVCIKRFSGGGTVVLDHDSIWTTVIARPGHFVKDMFPRPIMDWSSEALFGPLFQRLTAAERDRRTSGNSNNDNSLPLRNHLAQGGKQTMVLDTKSCVVENTGRMIRIPVEQNELSLLDRHELPEFRLVENDYVLGERKMGGNAQSISSKTGWLHHTSFLWDFQQENMDYLTLPDKRPEYRADRTHTDFLVKLKDNFSALRKREFISHMAETVQDQFDVVEHVTLRDALRIVSEKAGGLQRWFDNKSRNKVLQEL